MLGLLSYAAGAKKNFLGCQPLSCLTHLLYFDMAFLNPFTIYEKISILLEKFIGLCCQVLQVESCKIRNFQLATPGTLRLCPGVGHGVGGIKMPGLQQPGSEPGTWQSPFYFKLKLLRCIFWQYPTALAALF